MEDKTIVDLYWQRSEQAIAETSTKYGKFCYQLAYHVLENREDAEESVNDTYWGAWKAMPPHRPAVLSAFLAKLTRRISITRWYSRTADKRGGGQVSLALEELADCEAEDPGVEEKIVAKEACEALNRFLGGLPETERKVFLRRYFLLESVAEVAAHFHFTEAKTTSMLYRTRLKLRKAFMEEGYL